MFPIDYWLFSFSGFSVLLDPPEIFGPHRKCIEKY